MPKEAPQFSTFFDRPTVTKWPLDDLFILQIPIPATLKVFVVLFISVLTVFAATQGRAQTPHWVRWPTPGAPASNASAAAPHGPVYQDFGELLESSDSGFSWNPLPYQVVQSGGVAVDPSNSMLYHYGTYFLYFSSNAGRTWDSVPNNPFDYGFAFAPQGGLLRISKDTLWYSATSTSGWTYRGVVDTSLFGWSICSGSPAHILARCQQYLRVSSDSGAHWITTQSYLTGRVGYIMARDNIGFFSYDRDTVSYVSDDYGITWKTTHAFRSVQEEITDQIIAPNHTIFATLSPGRIDKQRTVRSTDMGNSWSMVRNDASSLASDSSGIVYAGAYRSFDNGDSWQYSSYGLKVPPLTSIAIADSGRLYSMSLFSGKTFRSIDSTADWTLATNQFVYQFLPRFNGLLTLAENKEIDQSTDNGWTWKNLDSSLTGIFTGIAEQPNHSRLASTTDGHALVRLDIGLSFQYQTVIDPPEPLFGLVNIGNVAFTASAEHLFSRSDDGSTWAIVSLPDTSGVTALAVGSNGLLFVGLRSHQIIRSADLGKTWGVIRSFPSGFAKCILPISKTTLVAAMSGDSSSPPSGVFISKDNGISWDSMSIGLHPGESGRFPKSLAMAYDSSKQRVYLTTSDAANYFIDLAAPARQVASQPSTLTEIYPDPVANVLYLTLPHAAGEASVAIYDLLGRRVTSARVGGHADAPFELNVAALSSGVYSLVVTSSVVTSSDAGRSLLHGSFVKAP